MTHWPMSLRQKSDNNWQRWLRSLRCRPAPEVFADERQTCTGGVPTECPGTCTTVSWDSGADLHHSVPAREQQSCAGHFEAACLGAHLFSIGTSLSRLPVTHQSDQKQVVALVLGDLKATLFSFPSILVNKQDNKTSSPGSRDGSRRHVTKYLDMRSLNSCCQSDRNCFMNLIGGYQT